MNNFLGSPAFSAGARVFTWGDVVLAAILRGDWTTFVEGIRRRLALAASVQAGGDSPSDEEVEAAADEFRYERDLITAEDMEAWLARQGLTMEEWMEYLERSLLVSRAVEKAADAVAHQPDDESISSCIGAEAICSGALSGFGVELAARVAIDDREASEAGTSADPDPEEIDRVIRAFSGEIERFRSRGLPASPERLAELARLELAFQSHRRRPASAPALRAQIDAHRLDWVRLDLQGLSFSDEAAAREAALCLREDGESLEDVAASAHVRMREERVYLDEIDPIAKPDLLSARPGELVGPVEFGERFHVFLLREKTMPSEDDPDVRRRAEEALLAKIVEQEMQGRIRWLDPR